MGKELTLSQVQTFIDTLDSFSSLFKVLCRPQAHTHDEKQQTTSKKKKELLKKEEKINLEQKCRIRYLSDNLGVINELSRFRHMILYSFNSLLSSQGKSLVCRILTKAFKK